MGNGPSSHSSSIERVCFMMAFCSFGGVSDQCGETSWAAHETGMVPLLSCEIDMTEWLKEKWVGREHMLVNSLHPSMLNY